MEHSVLEELDRTNKDLSQTQAELRKYIGKRKVTEGEIRKVEADISVNRANSKGRQEGLRGSFALCRYYGYSGDVVILLSTSGGHSSADERRWRYIQGAGRVRP